MANVSPDLRRDTDRDARVNYREIDGCANCEYGSPIPPNVGMYVCDLADAECLSKYCYAYTTCDCWKYCVFLKSTTRAECGYVVRNGVGKYEVDCRVSAIGRWVVGDVIIYTCAIHDEVMAQAMGYGTKSYGEG